MGLLRRSEGNGKLRTEHSVRRCCLTAWQQTSPHCGPERPSPALEGYATISRLLTGQSGADVKEGIDWVRELCIELTGPALRAWASTKLTCRVLPKKQTYQVV
jgi:hypothetical protein